MDVNRTGYLSIISMAELLSSNSEEQLTAMLKETSPTGKVTYEQFRKLMLED